MAAFTPNSGGTVNWDTLSGGSVNATLDTYAISNNTTLLIDTDSYQCANHSAAFGSLDTVSFSGLGGKLKLDGKNVRVIPYNTGTGNVPAIGTTISQSGGTITGYLLGVWSGWQAEPTAAGSAMPASGFIKIKNKVGNFSSGAITGIGASATGADVVGWIEVRGADTAQITVPRLGTFEVDGDWFELGTTNGTRGQVLACPTTATVAGVFAGVQIETSAGSGVYEWYASVGSLAAASTIPTDSTRGKIVWQTTSGIRIGSDGTNNVGYLPATGCKVRIPNVIMTCCTRTAGSGSGPRVLPNATVATRQEFITTGAGTISISKGAMQWYANFSQPFAVTALDSVFNDTLVQSEVSSALDTRRCLVSVTQAQGNSALTLTSCFGGGTVEDNFLVRVSLGSGAYCTTFNYVTGVTFSRNKIQTITNKSNATSGVLTATQLVNCTFTDILHIGGRALLLACSGCLVTGTATYCENFSGTTGTSYSHSIFEFSGGSSNCIWSANVSLPVTNNQPYFGLVGFSASYNCLVYGIGTFASPINLGSTNATGYIIASGGNSSGHKIKRCYASSTRSGVMGFNNSDTGILVENCAGDYADGEYLVALNSINKGVACTPGTTGQTSVYGSHWFDCFTAATTGRVVVCCNEPTAASAAQCAVTSGLAIYNSSGQVSLRSVGDEVVWTMPSFCKGHTAFQNVAPTLTGTNTGNLTYNYQIDTGSGWSAWKTLNATNLSGETISASTGFKLKVRATCNTANTGNLLAFIRIDTSTTSAAQSENNYTLTPATLTLTGLVTGSDIVLLTPGTTTELSNTDAHGSSTFAWEYDAGVVTGADVCVYKAGYVPYIVRGLTLTSAGASIPIQQVSDRNYSQ
jgi:hypothetical protein